MVYLINWETEQQTHSNLPHAADADTLAPMGTVSIID